MGRFVVTGALLLPLLLDGMSTLFFLPRMSFKQREGERKNFLTRQNRTCESYKNCNNFIFQEFDCFYLILPLF